MVLNLQEEISNMKNSNNIKNSNNANNLNLINLNTQKELDLLREKVDLIEKDNNEIIKLNNEELKKYKEKFSQLINYSYIFIDNIRNLFYILKKNIPLEEFLSSINSSNKPNDIINRENIFDRIETEITKFEYLFSKSFSNINSEKEYITSFSNLIFPNTNQTHNNSITNFESSFNQNPVKDFNIGNRNFAHINTVNTETNINNNSIHKEVFENTKLNLIASREKNRELIEFINKLELKNKLLEEQFEITKYNYNSELKQKFSEENNKMTLNNSMNVIKTNPNFYTITQGNSDLVNEYKSEIEELKSKNIEVETTINYIKKLNKDLESKNNLLEEELIKTKKI